MKIDLSCRPSVNMVEKIAVFPDKRIEIKFRFHGKDFEEVLQQTKGTRHCLTGKLLCICEREGERKRREYRRRFFKGHMNVQMQINIR